MKAFLVLVGVLFTLFAASTLAADAAAGEAATKAAIPVPAEDVEELAFDAEVDKALHSAETGELAIEAEDVDADADLEEGTAADETELLSESESVSVAVAETDGEESASAQVDADEDTAFIAFEAEVKESAEEDEEEEESDEAEEGSYESEAESVTFERDAEDMQVVDGPRLMESAADVAAHARAHALTSTAIEAEVETGAAGSDSQMVEVADFNTDALEAAEAKSDAPVATGGAVTAGVAGATIESKPLEAEALPVTKEVLTVVTDEVARNGGYPEPALVETDASLDDEDEEADESEDDEEESDESEEEGEDEAEDEDSEEADDEEAEEAEEDSEADAESEQQQLALMHSMLLSIREHSGVAVDEAITPEEMDQIEEKLAVTEMIETNAADATATAAAAAGATATTAAAATTTAAAATTTAAADTEHKAEAKAEAKTETAAAAATATTTTTETAAAATTAATGPLVVKPNESPSVDAVTAGGVKLHKVKVWGEDKPKKRRSKYRFDVHYDDEVHDHFNRRRAQYRGDIELTDKPMWRKPRDYTKVSLKNPKKPVILKPRKRLDRRPKYRYDVTYEKRASCCRNREACCIRGVHTKVLSRRANTNGKKSFKVSGTVRIESPRPQGMTPIVAFDHVDHHDHLDHDDHIHYPQFDHYDIIRPPQSRYRGDVEYVNNFLPKRRVVEAGVKKAGSSGSFSAQEFEYLKRIHERQRLLHKLLQTHPAEYVDEHELANFVWQNEPAAAAATPEAALVYNSYDAYFPRRFRSEMVATGSGALSAGEFRELQDWLSNLPRVPELSVVEVSSDVHGNKKWVAPKIVPGLIDLTHHENTEKGVMDRLTQIPEPAILLQEAEQLAVAEDSVETEAEEQEEDAEAEAEDTEDIADADEQEGEDEAEDETEDL